MKVVPAFPLLGERLRAPK
jgi:hypothetical protein